MSLCDVLRTAYLKNAERNIGILRNTSRLKQKGSNVMDMSTKSYYYTPYRSEKEGHLPVLSQQPY